MAHPAAQTAMTCFVLAAVCSGGAVGQEAALQCLERQAAAAGSSSGGGGGWPVFARLLRYSSPEGGQLVRCWAALLLPTLGLAGAHGWTLVAADRYAYLPSALVLAPATAKLYDSVNDRCSAPAQRRAEALK